MWEATYNVMEKYMGMKPTVPLADTYTDAYLPANLPSCH